jgi:hypothetical protein
LFSAATHKSAYCVKNLQGALQTLWMDLLFGFHDTDSRSWSCSARAWVTGHPSSFTTIHARSALEALPRLDGLVQQAGVPPQPRLICETIHLLVVIALTPSGRQVTEIATISGYDPTIGYQLTPVADEEEPS